jgi:hypothetical protein
MPLGGLLSVGLAAAPGAYQVFKGLRQAKEARKLRYQDLTPAAFQEELANSRLAANNQRMPGMGLATDKINQGFSNSMNNAVQAGTGSAGILATLGRLDQNRNSAFLSLGQQAAQFQNAQQGRLSGNLRQQAAYQQQSRDAFNRERAALKEASSRNTFGGLSTIAGAGVMGATGGYTGMKNFSGYLNQNQGALTPVGLRQPVLPGMYRSGYQLPGSLPGYNSYKEQED